MGSTYLAALDAGGGGGHCLLVDAATGEVTRGFRAWKHPVAPGTSGTGTDLDLDRIWRLLAEATAEALARAGAGAEQVAGIAATSMRHSTVALDGEGAVVLAAPNRDSRAFAEGYALAERSGEEIYAATGHWPSPVCTAARLRWLAAPERDALRRVAAVVSLGDWIAYRLCGELATDATQASETLLLDVHARTWAADLAERLAIPQSIFPPLVEPGTRIGALREDAARALGLRAGIPVAAGAADTQCGLLGESALEPGQAAAICGTTAPVQLVVDRPLLDAERRLWTSCHVLPDRWVLESNAGPVGEVLDWLAGLLHGDVREPVARLLAEAALSEPGAAGMLSSLGVQVMNARKLELPLGELTLSHLCSARDPLRRAHLERAVLEGMACGVRANLEQAADVASTRPGSLRLAGGMARSRLFAALVSEVAGVPVELGATAEATGLGAAVCAGVGAGAFGDLRDGSRRLAGAPHTVTPDPARQARYAALFTGWQRLRAARVASDEIARDLVLPALLARIGEAAAPRPAAVRPKILVTADLDEASLEALRALGEVEAASFRRANRLLTGGLLRQALDGVDVFVTEIDVLDADAVAHAPSLRAVFACRGDAVNVDVAACTAFGIPVLHAPGRNADAVADLTLAFLLMLARRLPAAAAFLHRPDLEAGDVARMGEAFRSLQGHELWGRTIGLIGLGAVARAVAARLAGFGARVLVSDPFVREEDAVLAGATAVSLDALLEQSDFVSLHAAVTEQTRGMIGAAQLARMRPGACLVNTARAALIDEEALVAALQRGHLGGAAVDVFPVEPPGASHPLLALENVIATPHVGGNTHEVAAHQGSIVVEELTRMIAGERPRHALNPGALEGFDWTRPRPPVDERTLAALKARPAPAVADTQRRRPADAAGGAAAGGPAAAQVAPSTAPGAAPRAVVERLEGILRSFTARVAADPGLRAFAADKAVGLHFLLPDVGLDFHLALDAGRIDAGLGAAAAPPDVTLKMRADILDGMFTGRVNAMQAAMGGKLSFSGDTVKAMTLQEIQEDLSRLYRAARDEVGDPGDLAAIGAPAAPAPAAAGAVAAGGAAVSAARTGDVRDEIVRVLGELFATGLITATGGNISARVEGTSDQIWITPGQIFKGELRPDMMVRLDLDGRVVDAGALSPSSERMVHCALYRAKPEATAVIHAHAPHATILANAGLPFVPVSTEAAFFAELPCVPFLMPGSDALARAVGEAASRSWGVLMRNHGIVVAGRSLRRTASMAEVIERSAQIILGCHAVGREPSVLPADTVSSLRKMGELLA